MWVQNKESGVLRQTKQRLEFRTAEVSGICVREEGAQEMYEREPVGTSVEEAPRAWWRTATGGLHTEWEFWRSQSAERYWGFKQSVWRDLTEHPGHSAETPERPSLKTVAPE